MTPLFEFVVLPLGVGLAAGIITFFTVRFYETNYRR